jgi:hypothetical protein
VLDATVATALAAAGLAVLQPSLGIRQLGLLPKKCALFETTATMQTVVLLEAAAVYCLPLLAYHHAGSLLHMLLRSCGVMQHVPSAGVAAILVSQWWLVRDSIAHSVAQYS